ncbi:Mitochondrial import receptor subunit TOM20 [Candida viswanathii]|uniref:Mitochondrial import receptor subunit TOM20 n=1 Tax=Candida viswanathii TaxID=5486 RepID=A0A367Y424_9ASCO|nr:Mitochondrial import receptor subunit TOM20 [Candida viswanathii]
MNKALTITAVAAAALAGYAVYFDYQCRHSTDFRKSLKKRDVKQKKLKAKQEAESKQNKLESVKKALLEDLEANPIPTDLSEREAFFMEQVAVGEQKAKTDAVEAAICFYKALAVYPNPTDILGIYQKTVPEDVYELVVMMIAVYPPASVSSILSKGAPTVKDLKPTEEDLD